MKYIAFFATETPHPDQRYAGIPIGGTLIYIRAVDVTNGPDPLEAGANMELPGETLLNTLEVGEEAPGVHEDLGR